jgi:beta-lactamase class D
MKRPQYLLFALLFSFFMYNSCTVNNVTINDEIGEVFAANKVNGTFGMFDNSRGSFTIYDLDRFKTAYSPGQTFNIITALVGLHVGRVSDDSSLISITDTTGIAPMNVYQTFHRSSSDHVRALAKMIGRDTIKYWVDSVKYGNKKIDKANMNYWANDSLKISADEQLGLIKRLYFRQHPFRASVQESVKKMLIVENNAQYQLAYQLGVAKNNGKQIGWVVGWMEENRHVYPFVINFDAAAGVNTNEVGVKLAKEILLTVGFYKGRM